MITKSIAQLDILGLMALDFARSIPKAVYSAFMVVPLVLMGQSAQAAPTVLPTQSDDLTSFIGCPTLDWAAPLQGTSQDITGMLGGFAIIAILIIMFIIGITLLFAGRRQDKAQGAIEGAKNAGLGFAFIFIAIPIGALVFWGIATGLNPNC